MKGTRRVDGGIAHPAHRTTTVDTGTQHLSWAWTDKWAWQSRLLPPPGGVARRKQATALPGSSTSARQAGPVVTRDRSSAPLGRSRSDADHLPPEHLDFESMASGDERGESRAGRVKRKVYEAELLRLQAELLKLQQWVRAEGRRLVVIFEGRDAAGKGGAIKRVTEHLNPRFARIAALPASRPSASAASGTSSATSTTSRRPARSCCSTAPGTTAPASSTSWVSAPPDEYHRFLHQCPIFERLLVEDGILLRKYWFSVSQEEQERRFHARADDPLRTWKLSPMDPESITRWDDYSRAKDQMIVHTDIPAAPWYVVESDDKRAARLNMIAHLLSTIDYHDVAHPGIKLPKRPKATGYVRPPRDEQHYVPDHAATLG